MSVVLELCVFAKIGIIYLGTSELELFFCRWNAQDVTLRHVLRMIFSCTRLDRARIYCR